MPPRPTEPAASPASGGTKSLNWLIADRFKRIGSAQVQWFSPKSSVMSNAISCQSVLPSGML